MRKSLAGSLNGDIGWGALRITLSISLSNYSTKSKKQGREVRTCINYKFVWIVKLIKKEEIDR
jgi:hypothetical protein